MTTSPVDPPDTAEGLAALYETVRARPRDAETGAVVVAFDAMVRARGSFSVNGVRYSWNKSEGCVFRRPDPAAPAVIQRGREPGRAVVFNSVHNPGHSRRVKRR